MHGGELRAAGCCLGFRVQGEHFKISGVLVLGSGFGA